MRGRVKRRQEAGTIRRGETNNEDIIREEIDKQERRRGGGVTKGVRNKRGFKYSF